MTTSMAVLRQHGEFLDYRRRTSYNVGGEKEAAVQNTDHLNEEQRVVHDKFVAAAFNTSGGLYL